MVPLNPQKYGTDRGLRICHRLSCSLYLCQTRCLTHSRVPPFRDPFNKIHYYAVPWLAIAFSSSVAFLEAILNRHRSCVLNIGAIRSETKEECISGSITRSASLVNPS